MALTQRYEEYGYDGLYDRRKGRQSPRRVPLVTVEQVLAPYRENSLDLNVRHEKLGEPMMRMPSSLSLALLARTNVGVPLICRVAASMAPFCASAHR